MEDTSIHLNNFPLNNHYLMGIFDGHGGIYKLTQVLKLLNMSSDTSLSNYILTPNLRPDNINRPWSKLSTKWILSCNQKQEKESWTPSSDKIL